MEEKKEQNDKKLILIGVAVIVLVLAAFIGIKVINKDDSDNTNDNNKSGEKKTETVLTSVYNKMQTGNNNNGYTTSLRMIGGYKGVNYNEDVIVNNYMNEKFKITEISSLAGKVTERHLYVVQGLVYTEVEAGLYKKSAEKTSYANPSAYLKTLEYALNLSAGESDKIEEVTYTKYTYQAKKELVKEMLKYTALGDIAVNSDVATTVWVDKDGYVYLIEYNLGPSITENETLILKVYYYDINQAIDYKYEDTGLEQ